VYSLLIVDDETFVVNGLAFDIPWEDSKISEVCRAYTAKQALQILEDNRIDIMITDIKMPGMDGLELAKAVRDQWSHTKVIIMSGFDDFKYAQRAIDLDVFSYITKPTPYEEIVEIVERAIVELEASFLEEKLIHDAEQSLRENKALLTERCLYSWIVEGQVFAISQERKLTITQPLLELPSLLLLIRKDKFNLSNQGAAGQATLEAVIRKILLKGEPFHLFKDRDDRYVAVIQKENDGQLHALVKYIRGIAEYFVNNVQRSLQMTVSVFWSEVLPNAQTLHENYLLIREKANRLLPWDFGVIQGPEPQTVIPEYQAHIKALSGYPDLSTLIDSLDKDAALQKLNRLFEQLGKCGNLSYDLILLIYYTVSSSLLRASLSRGVSLLAWAGDEASHFYDFRTIGTIVHLRSWCTKVITMYMNHMLDKENSDSSHLLHTTKKMIQERLNQDLSLQEIAATLHVHPNYLSRLFTKETGISITDYAISLRMEKAKSYLSEPGMKVFEVAEKVGYESVSHFNRIFKREVGMSPRDYQATLARD
jgi:two-component system, response regulator YesN